jgi:hypothetical protein
LVSLVEASERQSGLAQILRGANHDAQSATTRNKDDEQNGSIDMESFSNVYVGLLQRKAAPCGAACHFVSVRKAPAV